MVYQHHSAPLIEHSAPFEGSRYHDSNSNFSDLSFHHPKWLQPYVFPSFWGRLTRKKTDHLSVHTNPKVGRFRCFFLVGMMLECQNTHTHTHPSHATPFMEWMCPWGKSVGDSHLSAFAAENFVSSSGESQTDGCLCWNKNGDWQGGDLSTFSP